MSRHVQCVTMATLPLLKCAVRGVLDISSFSITYSEDSLVSLTQPINLNCVTLRHRPTRRSNTGACGGGDTRICENTNNGAKNRLGRSCVDVAIGHNQIQHLQPNFDTATFTASEMCCACGGGQTACTHVSRLSRFRFVATPFPMILLMSRIPFHAINLTDQIQLWIRSHAYRWNDPYYDTNPKDTCRTVI